MSNKVRINTNSSGGIGFGGLLLLLFIGLKLSGQITWSWWWVFVPLWGTVAIIFAIIIMAFILAVMHEHFKKEN